MINYECLLQTAKSFIYPLFDLVSPNENFKQFI